MADIGDAVYAVLSASSGITTLLGSGSSARIYPDEASETIGVTSYIVYKLVSDNRDFTMDGDSNLTHCRVQIDCLAPTKPVAKSLSAAALAALQGYKGTPGTSGIAIQSCFQGGRHSFVIPSVGDVNLRSFGYSIDFEIWYAG